MPLHSKIIRNIKRRYLTPRFSFVSIESFFLLGIAAGVGLTLGLLTNQLVLPNIFASSSPWTQTDWSGGATSATATGTVNTYLSDDDVSVTDESVQLEGTGGLAVLQGNQLSTGSTNFNTSSYTAIDFNVTQRHDDSTYDYNSSTPQRLLINEAGDYVVTTTILVDSDGVEDTAYRSGLEAEIRVNGTTYPNAVMKSAFMRNYNGHHESSLHGTFVLEDLQSSDYVEIFVKRSTNDGTHEMTAVATMAMEQVQSNDSIFTATADRTIASTNLNRSAEELEWRQSRADSGFTHSDVSSSNRITLDNEGTYFVAVNVPLESSITRGNIKAEVRLDGSVYNTSSFMQGYIRNQNQRSGSSIHWAGVIEASAGEELSVVVQQEANSGTITTGSDDATLYIEKIETSGLFSATGTQVNGQDNWNPNSLSNVNWSQQQAIDSEYFAHDTSAAANDDITILKKGLYQLTFSVPLQSGSVRTAPKAVVRVNGTAVTGAESRTAYARSQQNHDQSSLFLSSPLIDLEAGDVVTVGIQAESDITGNVSDLDSAALTIQRKGYDSAGHLISNIFDPSFKSDWGTMSYSSAGTGTLEMRARTDTTNDMSTATGWGGCTLIANDSTATDNSCISDGTQYFQYRVDLEGDNFNSPQLDDVSIAFSASDEVAPTTNASNAVLSGLSAGDWTDEAPTIVWTAGADDPDGTGLAGYCIALDEVTTGSSSALDPTTSSGLLSGLDDGVNLDACPFITTGTSLDLSAVSGLDLTSGNTYYFSIKAVDLSGNIWSGDNADYQDLTNFRFDDTPPSNPSLLSLPSDFIATKSATLCWSGDCGASTASDTDSGLAGYQYRIGSGGTWYGSSHNGNEDSSDLIPSDTLSYALQESPDFANLQEGTNNIYLRTWDIAGNTSNVSLQGNLKINTNAPSSPRNLSVVATEPVDGDTSDSDQNSYSFSWNEPTIYTGLADNISYCYSINTSPTVSSCTYTDAGVTSLEADAFATQPGENTLYVVARDEAGNINHATAATVTFTYSGTAPGIPTNIDIADVSVKTTQSWRLTINWEAPQDLGAGIDSYRIYRSDSNSNFKELSSVSGLSFVDAGLLQQTYFYKIKACDSANNCGALSETVSLYPDGKFEEPANLTAMPVVTGLTTRKATISWSTDRTSDSRVAFGTRSGEYLDEEPSNSTQVTAHTINLTNLEPGTTYYYVAKWTDEDGNVGRSEELSFTTDPAPTISEVEMTRVGIDSALLSFKAEGASQVRLYYGESTSFGGIQNISTSTTASTYTAQITGLLDGTKYYYKLNGIDTEGSEYEGTTLDFTTLPRPEISNLRLQEVRGTAQPTMLVTWESNTPISSIVNYTPLDGTAVARDQVDVTLKSGDHRMLLRGLLANTRYQLNVSGIDKAGNEAVSQPQSFTTATDTRPPQISNLKVEENLPQRNSDTPTAQLIVSWQTDEPATSQVEFGEGTGSTYGNRSQEDSGLKVNHYVVISNLSPSRVYHLRALSNDDVGNTGSSVNTVSITPKATNQALDLVVTNMQQVFGFLRSK